MTGGSPLAAVARDGFSMFFNLAGRVAYEGESCYVVRAVADFE